MVLFQGSESTEGHPHKTQHRQHDKEELTLSPRNACASLELEEI